MILELKSSAAQSAVLEASLYHSFEIVINVLSNVWIMSV